jgi:hypothetical protein
MEPFKRNALTSSVMTGITALFGGIEPASAGLISLPSVGFDVTASDSASGTFSSASSITGSFADTGSDPHAFAMFNTLGGTRTLTQVVVNVNTTQTQLNADVSGNCGDISGNGSCGATAPNQSEFSAVIDLAGLGSNLSPSPQSGSRTATDMCNYTASVEPTCNYSDFPPSGSASLSVFSDTFTSAADLALFTGLSMYQIIPGLSLGGGYSASLNTTGITEPHSAWSVSADTTWTGTIDVEYTFEENAAVPEPATLFLFGTGLAGLGLLRRKPKSSA